jgi:excisionase family DNA binding protein
MRLVSANLMMPTTEASCGSGKWRRFWKRWNGGKSGSADSGRASPFFYGFLGQSTLIWARLRIRRTRYNGDQIMKERWLSVAEIAAHLGVNPDTIYKWIERKQLPAHKAGRLWKFTASEVDEWVRAGKAAEPERET